jgi:hypothetical protein
MSDFTKDAMLVWQVPTDVQRFHVSDKHTAAMGISQSSDQNAPRHESELTKRSTRATKR